MKLINLLFSTAALNAGAVLSSTTSEPDAVGSSEPHTENEANDESTTTSTPSWQLITMTTPAGPLFVAPSVSRCTAEERAVWIGNQDFSRAYQRAATSAWGDSVDTVTNLAPAYPGISRLCLTCLGEATGCARTNCWADCILDQSAEACQTCINDNCIPAMLVCTGAANANELPLTPQPVAAPVSPSTRMRPSRLPSIQVPERSVSSGSDHSPAATGPGRLRANDSDWEDHLAYVRQNPAGTVQLNGINVMTLSLAMAFLAALVGVVMKLFS